MKKSRLVLVLVVSLVLVTGTLIMDRARRGADGPGIPAAVRAARTPETVSALSSSSSGSTGAAQADQGGAARPAPQTKPVPLGRVSTPPSHTVAFVDSKSFTPLSRYSVTFVPFGRGPQDSTLVILVKSSAPQGSVSHPFDFEGKSMLVGLRGSRSTVTRGGTYAGVIQLVGQGDLLQPMLSDVESAR